MSMSMIPLASAYPSTELSAVQLAMMIVIPVGLLFAWLGVIFLAARPPRSAVQAANAHDAAPSQDADGAGSRLTRSA